MRKQNASNLKPEKVKQQEKFAAFMSRAWKYTKQIQTIACRVVDARGKKKATIW